MEMMEQIIAPIDLLATIFLFVVGSLILFITIVLLYMYISDISQTKQTIRRNYPIIGRFRYFFEEVGVFFRQYFFSMDREEMPFNRAMRSWVYSHAKKEGSVKGFGSTRDTLYPGSFSLANALIPHSQEDKPKLEPLVFGEKTVKKPYSSKSIFNISAMSYGAISKPAVHALSKGARMSGSWYNTGEGGLASHHLVGDCDLVAQIGTAKNGVRNKAGDLDKSKLRVLANRDQVKMLELKLSQGAKPGKGGILPQSKITKEIEDIRGISREDGAAISPNGHKEVDSPDSLIDLINTIRDEAQIPVGIKLVLGAETDLDGFFNAIVKRGTHLAPDFITLDSNDGGTGSAPEVLMDYLGMNITQSLPAVVQRLKEAGIRDQVRINASGKAVTSGKVAELLCIGADTIASARGFMFALGCIQALQCHQNTCPTGITTHNAKLQAGLVVEDKAARVANYVEAIHDDLFYLAHSCGIASPRDFKPWMGRIALDHGRTISADKFYYGNTDSIPLLNQSN